MSNTCPKCGTSGYEYCAIPDPYEGYWRYGCGSRTYPNGPYQQSDKCRIAELEAAKPILDDGTDWDTREARLDIEKMVDLLGQAMDVATRCTNIDEGERQIFIANCESLISKAWNRGI